MMSFESLGQVVPLGEAAAMLGLHPNSLRRLVRQGTGPREQRIGGHIFFTRREVERFRDGYDRRPWRTVRPDPWRLS